MRFAICNEPFENWKQEDVFTCAKKLGYSGVEIAPFTLADDVRRIPTADRMHLRKLADKSDIAIVGLHWLLAKTDGFHLTSPKAGIRKQTVDYLRELLRFCSDLGGKIMVFGSPKQRSLPEGISQEQGMQYATEVFKQVMSLAESLKVTIAIEPLARKETNFINTAAQGIELIRCVNHPNCQLHLDVKAMSDEGKPLPQIICESASYLVHYHANDPDGRGPGTTGLDHKPFATALKDINYKGWISVEVFKYKPDPRAIAASAIQYLQQVYS